MNTNNVLQKTSSPKPKVRKLTTYFEIVPKASLQAGKDNASFFLGESIPDVTVEDHQITQSEIFHRYPLALQKEKTIPEIATQPTQVKGISQKMIDLQYETDIGLYAGQGAKSVADNDYLKLKLLDSPWKPPKEYELPFEVRQSKGKEEKRCLRLDHFERCPYLAFSHAKQGLFCRICVLFGPECETAGCCDQQLKQLVAEPLKKYATLFGKDGYLTKHEGTQYHHFSVKRASDFRESMQKNQTVLKKLDQGLSKEADENRKRLLPIVQTIILCGRQNIPLRGHRDDGPLPLQTNESITSQEGNFRALLHFRIEAGDHMLKNHLLSSSRNATYISKSIQNELIESCRQLLQAKIVARLCQAKFFTVLADETTDNSRKEQLSLCVRYVELEEVEGRKKAIVREDFIDFIEVSDLTGKAVAATILQGLQNRGVPLTYLVGQGYDGAASMAGVVNGVQAIIRESYPTAIYVHCCNHALNLVITHASEEPLIRNAMAIIGNISNFFHSSAKRSKVLNDTVIQIFPETQKRRLLQLCETRWIERHDAVLIFIELISPIVSSLETCQQFERVTASEAVLLLNSILRSDFIVSTLCMETVLSITKNLSVKLQKVSTDLFSAMNDVNDVIRTIQDMRKFAETHFIEVWKKAKEIAVQVGIQLSQPRTAGRQTCRNNVVAESPMEYYRIAIFIPFLDHTISQLCHRFTSHNKLLFHLWTLIPQFVNKYSFDDLKPGLQLYEPFLDTESHIRGEFQVWQLRWSDKIDKPITALDALSVCDKDLFPNITTLLQILSTLPITTATAERSFSSLRLLKTYLRSTMSNDRLNGLTHLYVHRDLPLAAEDVINHFSATSARRLKFNI